MDKFESNIDIVFRNGLKDLEMLPPKSTWDKIRPSIKPRRRTYAIFKAAAIFTLFISLGFVAYRLIYNTVNPDQSIEISLLNEEQIVASETSNDRNSISFVSTENQKIKNTTNDVLDKKKNGISEIAEPELEQPDLYVNDHITKRKIIKNVSDLKAIQQNSLISSSVSVNESNSDKVYFTESAPTDISTKWSITALASPALYAKFRSTGNDFSGQLSSSEDIVTSSYSGGIALSFNVNKRFSIQSGLFYSAVGQQLDGMSSFGGFPGYDISKGQNDFEVITTNGVVNTNNSDAFVTAEAQNNRVISNANDVFDPSKSDLDYLDNSLKQNFSYIELPVFFRYKVIDRIIGLNVIGGVSYNILMNNSVYTEFDNVDKYTVGKSDGLNMTTLSSSIGMGMEYNFSNSFSFNLEPIFRYYLNPFDELTGSKLHPYSFGIFSGLSYKF